MNKRIYLIMTSLVTIAILWIGWLPPFSRSKWQQTIPRYSDRSLPWSMVF